MADGPALEQLVYPFNASVEPPPQEVPREIAAEFIQAASIVSISPMASAALGRRCLQSVLRAISGTKANLHAEINAAIAGGLPSHVADNLHELRSIGNFAAHPTKDQTTGEIVPVEEHEAEWTLEVLRGLFDVVYVQPAKDQARRAALSEKIAKSKGLQRPETN